MTLDEAVRTLLTLREQIPAKGSEARRARALLDDLERATTPERQRRLAERLLPLLARFDGTRAQVERISLDATPAGGAADEAEARRGTPSGSVGGPPLPGGGAADEAESTRGTPSDSVGRPPPPGVGRPLGPRRGAARRHPRFPRPGYIEGPTDAGSKGVMRRTPHLDVEGEAPIRTGSRRRVSVYVDEEDLRAGEHGDVLHLPDVDELQLGVTLTTSPHFKVVGSPNGQLVVRRAERRSSTATFEVDCIGAAEGNAGIAASFTYQWRPAGSVWREVEVEGIPVAPRSAFPAGEVVIDPDALPHDLLVRIQPIPGGDERHFDLTISSRHLSELRDGVSVRWDLPQDTKEYVRGYMEVFTDSEPSGRKAALIGAGKDMFSATPREFQEAYWALVESGAPLETIYVVTSEPFIPWELMVPNDGPRARRALGVEASVGRWVHEAGISPKQALSIKDSYVVAPRYRGAKKLAFSETETRLVIDTFDGAQISPARLKNIDETLGERGASLLHIVCHGHDDARGQILELDPDEVLHEVQLGGLEGLEKGMRESQPFVFINACEIGRPTPSLVGTGGFASRFIKLEARCVLAPIWSVKDSVAEEVARDFYRRVKTEPSVPFAKILRDIRGLAYEGESPEDSYAAYCFYGDPLAANSAASS